MTTTDDALEIARRHGVVRASDMKANGVSRAYLTRLHARGLLERVSRGVYTLTDADLGEHRDLIAVAVRVPGAVICLLSALRFHRLTTQAPFEVWFAIGRKARAPKFDHPSIRVVRFGADALRESVDSHAIGGVSVRVTSPARTVADCFKYRNTVGIDVALEAAREAIASRRCTPDDLARAAASRGMAKVMRTYLEALA